MDAKLAEMIQAGFYALLSGCALIAVNLAAKMSNTIEELRRDVHGLTKDTEFASTRFESVEEITDDHEARIRSLERQNGGYYND